jgi:hypothetical protein
MSPDPLAKARMRVIPGDLADVKEVDTTAELENPQSDCFPPTQSKYRSN